MNKELTPLEAYNELKNFIEDIFCDTRRSRAFACTSSSSYLIPFMEQVEKALKDSQRTIDKLSNEIKHLKATNRRNKKKLQALETIKQIFQFKVYEYEGNYYIRSSGSLSQIRKDTFDLLKEVLK